MWDSLIERTRLEVKSSAISPPPFGIDCLTLKENETTTHLSSTVWKLKILIRLWVTFLWFAAVCKGSDSLIWPGLSVAICIMHVHVNMFEVFFFFFTTVFHLWQIFVNQTQQSSGIIGTLERLKFLLLLLKLPVSWVVFLGLNGERAHCLWHVQILMT